MTTTITGTTVTFTDGSTWGGANGALTPAPNTLRTDTAFNIGHLILANCIFRANVLGYEAGTTSVWALNMTNQAYYTGQYAPANVYSVSPSTNLSFAYNDSRHGNQSYFALGNTSTGGIGLLTGSWRARGMACGAGINQTVGYFVLLERVA